MIKTKRIRRKYPLCFEKMGVLASTREDITKQELEYFFAKMNVKIEKRNTRIIIVAEDEDGFNRVFDDLVKKIDDTFVYRKAFQLLESLLEAKTNRAKRLMSKICLI